VVTEERLVDCKDIEESFSRLVKRVREVKNAFEEDMIVMQFLLETEKCIPRPGGSEVRDESEGEQRRSGGPLSKLRKPFGKR